MPVRAKQNTAGEFKLKTPFGKRLLELREQILKHERPLTKQEILDMIHAQREGR